MTRAEKEKSPARRSPGTGGRGANGTGIRGVASLRSKDDAVRAARQLGEEVLIIQVRRFTGRTRKIVEFEIPAIDAADLIERTKPLSMSVNASVEPTPKLTAAMGGPYIGPFKTKEELFDALEAEETG